MIKINPPTGVAVTGRSQKAIKLANDGLQAHIMGPDMLGSIQALP